VTDSRPSRPSAAVVLTRGHGDALETYWVTRGDAVGFMPGFRAFPGGTVSREDSALEIEGLGEGNERTIRACLLREAFEETGVLLAAPGSPLGDLAAARTRLLAGEARFADLARAHGWRFRADALTPAGRWISPPFAPARFEAWYFLARVPDGQEPSIRVGELAAGEWVRPVEALKRWQEGRETFAAPILYTLIAIAEGEDGLAERMARWPEASGQPIRRIELKWGIVLHPMRTRPLPPATHTNAYLVGDRELALIDPGSGDADELARLFDLIELLGTDDRRVKLILLTHHHPDHVGGVEVARQRYGVKVAAHAETAKHVPLDFTLADGDIVPLAPGLADWTLRAIHTPGHARGHLCFLHPRTGSLFSGDHITGGTGTVIVDPPEGDMGDYVRSLERLLAEPVSTLFPGHGSPQGAPKRRIRWLIEHRREREGRVIEALRSLAPAAASNPAPIGALVERAYDDTPRDLWPYAERSLLAHLLKLESEGKATRAGEGWRTA
jgi:ribonuclease/clavin/mitogillin